MKFSSKQPLIGSWIERGAKVVADDVELEIERLLREELKHFAVSDENWSQLLVDENNNEYWELTHPKAQMHGGGPKMLSHVTKGIARSKYGI